jgi:hypothetical protein
MFEASLYEEGHEDIRSKAIFSIRVLTPAGLCVPAVRDALQVP